MIKTSILKKIMISVIVCPGEYLTDGFIAIPARSFEHKELLKPETATFIISGKQMHPRGTEIRKETMEKVLPAECPHAYEKTNILLSTDKTVSRLFKVYNSAETIQLEEKYVKAFDIREVHGDISNPKRIIYVGGNTRETFEVGVMPIRPITVPLDTYLALGLICS